jgi:hypothetical protein
MTLFSILLSFAFAYGFHEIFVPRSLSELQVAFPTGPKRYEVHKVTANTKEAKELLASEGMRFGITVYLMALTGAILVATEWSMYQLGFSDGLHKFSLALALVLIAFPAVISSGVSMSAQIITRTGGNRATLQEASTFRNGVSISMVIMWFTALIMVWYILGFAGVGWDRKLALIGTLAFAPSFIAYGRVMGSSWTALAESSKMLSRGEPSAFYPYKPGARKQFVSTLVYFNTAVMPYIAFNTLVSLVLILIDDGMFVHSERVLALPEYRIQSSIMEEGGLLGFFIIEMFSYIPEAGIRVPLVSLVLLFLLLNVAIIGFLFVYEVARILFLDIADISGKGGIRLADSRLLRSEKSQQASVLNFCFTGFAGQSMLLLALAMLTFWDSQYLPQGQQCGSWQGSICEFIRKDALEEMTWMLSAGGQIVFLGIWMLSRRTGQHLSDISFDAKAVENRVQLESIENLIYRQDESFIEMIANDEWSIALERMERLYEDHGEEAVEGLSLVKRTEASMELLMGLGRWDQAEQVALSFLALRAGRRAEIARLILVGASLAQRDIPEAIPRLELLSDEDIEAARMKWITSILKPSIPLPNSIRASLKLDPITKRNIDLLRRYKEGAPASDLVWINDPPGRMQILSDIARFRIWNQSEIALDRIELWVKKENIDLSKWPQGQVARALLYLDRGMAASAIDIIRQAIKKHPRHPNLRRMAIWFARKGEKISLPENERTGLIWADTMAGEWEINWLATHNVAVAPTLEHQKLKQHAWNANAWACRRENTDLLKGRKDWKQFEWQIQPVANHLLLAGLVTTIGGAPIDLGLPGWIDINQCEQANLLDL